jgi:hypothetical protein
MKIILFTRAQATNFISYFVVGRGIAMFSYLTLGTNRAMFVRSNYLTPPSPNTSFGSAVGGTNRVLQPKYLNTKATFSKEMGVIYINFIKALLLNRLNLYKTRFKNQDEIISYLEKFQGDKLFTKSQISKLKNQGEFERVPLTPKSKEFINYVKKEFPEFNKFEFVLVKAIKETKTAMASKVQPTLVESKVELKESSLAQG